jgi:hypothetical protein
VANTPSPFARVAGRAVDQREERQAATLALVVGLHDDRDIFQADDDHHRPEDQAEHAINMEPVGNDLVVAGEGLAEGVDWRGPDVAEDDSDSADRQLSKAALGVAVRSILRGIGIGPTGGCDVHRAARLAPTPAARNRTGQRRACGL